MKDKKIKGSLSELVDKIHETYHGFIKDGFSPGVDRRVVPVMKDGELSGWKMQCYENDVWVDFDGASFETMEELIEYYKKDNKETPKN